MNNQIKRTPTPIEDEYLNLIGQGPLQESKQEEAPIEDKKQVQQDTALEVLRGMVTFKIIEDDLELSNSMEPPSSNKIDRKQPASPSDDQAAESPLSRDQRKKSRQLNNYVDTIERMGRNKDKDESGQAISDHKQGDQVQIEVGRYEAHESTLQNDGHQQNFAESIHFYNVHDSDDREDVHELAKFELHDNFHSGDERDDLDIIYGSRESEGSAILEVKEILETPQELLSKLKPKELEQDRQVKKCVSTFTIMEKASQEEGNGDTTGEGTVDVCGDKATAMGSAFGGTSGLTISQDHQQAPPQVNHIPEGQQNFATSKARSSQLEVASSSRDDESIKRLASVDLLLPKGRGPTQVDTKSQISSAPSDNTSVQIEKLTRQIQVSEMKNDIQYEMNEAIRKEFLHKYRSEVDFHHRVAYKFERAYRLRKTHPEKRKQLDLEIIEVVSEHSEYIEQDQMAIFYLLFFCIIYNNHDIVQFLRVLRQKMRRLLRPLEAAQIDFMLGKIDTYGLELLRKTTEPAGEEVYVSVFRQAISDNLRIVYGKILRKLTFLSLRDEDGKVLLETRDYELIQLTFSKFTNKKYSGREICSGYRQYNPAYFEEIILKFNVEPRISQNYRERFIVNSEAIYEVLLMYSKKDYLEHFLNVDTSSLAHCQILSLFTTCLKFDSLKIALKLYLSFFKSSDFTPEVLDILISSIEQSLKYLELKLFFLHSHFDSLNIVQLHQLVDTLLEMFQRKDFKQNPMLSQINSIKVALLIYRTSWRIERKKIYSLITKCQMINSYILKSLENFLEEQHNIAQLHRMVMEPFLDMEKEGDQLDMMREMTMEGSLNHPVLVEVVNLVSEGKYSINQSILFLSETFFIFSDLSITQPKSMLKCLLLNLQTLGVASGDRKQNSLQFHIWKQCLEQRFFDEVIFTAIACVALYVNSVIILFYQQHMVEHMTKMFTGFIADQTYLLRQAHGMMFMKFCKVMASDANVFLALNKYLSLLRLLTVLIGLGSLTAIVQQFVICQLKKNAEIKKTILTVDFLVLGTSFALFFQVTTSNENRLISDTCEGRGASSFSEGQASILGNIFFIIQTEGHLMSFQIALAALILVFTMKTLLLLERTEHFGHLILTIKTVICELGLFAMTVSCIFFSFVIALRLLQEYLLAEGRTDEFNAYQAVLHVFSAMNGGPRKEFFSFPQGQTFIDSFSILAALLLMPFLATMFMIRFFHVHKNIEATKRLEIISLRNSRGFDTEVGALTLGFFPFNIVLLPFVAPLALFKSERLSDFVLKMQYTLMIGGYCIIGACLAVVGMPLMYIKAVANQLYILKKNRVHDQQWHLAFLALVTVLGGSVIIILSIIIDLLSIHIQLLREESRLEFKYVDNTTLSDKDQVLVNFAFVDQFLFKFAYRHGVMETKSDMMKRHMKMFKIISNYHAFFCTGKKSYKEAVANIKSFNLSKILCHKCAVPNQDGERSKDELDYGIIHNITLDMLTFNFYQRMISEAKQGTLLSISEMVKYGHPFIEGTHECRIPESAKLYRDPRDLFSLFNIRVVSTSFTEVDEKIQQHRVETDYFTQEKKRRKLAMMQDKWVHDVRGTLHQVLGQLDSVVIDHQKQQTAEENSDAHLVLEAVAKGISSIQK